MARRAARFCIDIYCNHRDRGIFFVSYLAVIGRSHTRLRNASARQAVAALLTVLPLPTANGPPVIRAVPRRTKAEIA